MKKKQIVMILILFVIVIISVIVIQNKTGNVSFVKTSFNSTKHHTEQDIKETMKIVKKAFQKDYMGCTLQKLWYDDTYSIEYENDWLKQYEGTEVIILLSDFKTGSSGGDGSLSAKDTYTGWQWILVKNKEGIWQLETWGY